MSQPKTSEGSDAAAAHSALVQALAQFLDPPRVEQALALWALRCQGEGSLFQRLDRYCREIADGFGLHGKEVALHLDVLRTLQNPAGQTLPGSLEPPVQEKAADLSLRRRENPLDTATPARSTSGGVLQSFYAALEVQLARELPPGVTPARLRRTLIRHAQTLPRPQQHAASLWWSGQIGALRGDWPAGGCGTALANVMYVALAELLGPVHADRCFTQAVARLEASKDPALAAIRRFL